MKLLRKIILGISLSISSLLADPFLGEIKMFAGNFAPRGWAFCDGQLLPIAQNTALFSLLGTTYGGDGRTTFGLPDLRGRTAIHAGNGPGLSNISQGARGGSENISRSTVKTIDSTEIRAGRTVIASISTKNTYIESPTTSSVTKRSPYTSVRYIISITGIFPSRS